MAWRNERTRAAGQRQNGNIGNINNENDKCDRLLQPRRHVRRDIIITTRVVTSYTSRRGAFHDLEYGYVRPER